MADRGRVIRLSRITREMVRAQPDTFFVFGDNMARVGLGGQAKEMRGEPNAVGVPTKWSPDRSSYGYFTDDALRSGKVVDALREAFECMRRALAEGRDVVIPANGLGTGLAELPTRAPRLHARIEVSIRALEGEAAPLPVRVLVCGGRDYRDRVALWAALDALHAERSVGRLIHGAAAGADTLAGEWAEARRVPVSAYPADWQTHGRAAGPIRNGKMLNDGRPDLVLAFPGGRGTADMVRQAEAAGVPVRRVGWDDA